jgi:hypothetical protein
MEQEIAKYRKKIKPKTVQKSNHKHNYIEPVIYVMPYHSYDIFWVKYRCPVCGKLATIGQDWLHRFVDSSGYTRYHSMSLEEAKRQHPDYPVIYEREL